jgi:hypothetical protein
LLIPLKKKNVRPATSDIHTSTPSRYCSRWTKLAPGKPDNTRSAKSALSVQPCFCSLFLMVACRSGNTALDFLFISGKSIAQNWARITAISTIDICPPLDKLLSPNHLGTPARFALMGLILGLVFWKQVPYNNGQHSFVDLFS